MREASEKENTKVMEILQRAILDLNREDQKEKKKCKKVCENLKA